MFTKIPTHRQHLTVTTLTSAPSNRVLSCSVYWNTSEILWGQEWSGEEIRDNLYVKPSSAELKVPHYTKTYIKKKPTRLLLSQDGNSNVLLNCLCQLIWLNIIIAQWLKYPAWGCCSHFWIKVLKINFLLKNSIFFNYLIYIYLLHHIIYHKQVKFCWFEQLFQGVVNHLKSVTVI